MGDQVRVDSKQDQQDDQLESGLAHFFQGIFFNINTFIFNSAYKCSYFIKNKILVFQTVNAMKEDGFDIRCRVPRMMSETRFPNYVAKVFSALRYD